jgi:hypothetical protein
MKKGETAWKQALSLFRLQREQAGGAETIQKYVNPNRNSPDLGDLEIERLPRIHWKASAKQIREENI